LNDGKDSRNLLVRLGPKETARGSRSLRALTWVVLLSAWSLSVGLASAQDALGEDTNSLHGVVVNSITREPISRALVASPDNRFATMTDSQGHFEFAFPKTEAGTDGTRGDGSSRPSQLVARKPGYLTDPDQDLQLDPGAKEISISLAPEAVIVGSVKLPTAEAADRIQVEYYRREVQEGRARWVLSGTTTTRSNGEFRFAELAAGTYKLLTRELLDRDQPALPSQGEQLYGYPPVYFPNATDFADAESIQLVAGQTFQADLDVVRQPYYPVKVAVANPPLGGGVNVSVSPRGSHGPGYALGYNQQTHMIEGLLPQGVYTLEVSGYGPPMTTGTLNLAVHGAPLGATMTMVPLQSISVNVKEEFSTAENPDNLAFYKSYGRLRGSRQYLNLLLEPADDFGQAGAVGLRPPSGPNDAALVFEGVAPGRYWLHIDSGRGYVASVTAGGVDLLLEPLVVAGDASSPAIEITMRDDSAQIEGTVEGANASLSAANILAASLVGVSTPEAYREFAHVYFVPLPDSPGRFTEVVMSPDGTFSSPELPPGAYRVLAFKRQQTDLEYRNPDAMRIYDAKGPVVHLTAGQKEHLTLQLISKGE